MQCEGGNCMMWLIETLINLFLYPIDWWWDMYEKYRKSKSTFKMILLFITSIMGLVVIFAGVLWLSTWLLSEHLDKLILGGLVVYAYSYVKSQRDKKADETKVKQEEEMRERELHKEMQMDEKAKRCYFSIRSIMFDTLKKCVKHIESEELHKPRDIDMTEDKYEIVNDIIFFKFRLSKEDKKKNYDDLELQSFADIIRRVLARKLHEGDDENFGTTFITDTYGNQFEKLNVDRLEDWGECFVVYVVAYTEGYAEYWRNKRLNSSEDCVREHNDKDF